MTDKALRALQIVNNHPGILPTEFAGFMWPDSPAWRRSYKCGPKGSCDGRMLVQSAGGFLGKLKKQELVQYGPSWGRPGWYLTVHGLRALSQGRRVA